jgi:geranylgeranylglycerol-phosphate geranylgeranyltransferase
VWYNIYSYLSEEKHFNVVLSNPVKTRAIASAKIKTDKLDAAKLANLLRGGYIAECYVPDRRIMDLRELVRHRTALVRMRTKLKNKIHSIVLMKGIQISWVRSILLVGQYGTTSSQMMSKQVELETIKIKLVSILNVFTCYIKARSQVYIFAFATFISFSIYAFSLFSLPESNTEIIFVLDIGLKLIASSYFLFLATYIYNDLADFDVDKINYTNRPFVKDKVTKSNMVVCVLTLYFVGLILALSVSLVSFFITTIILALGISYSNPKTNLKDKFPLKTVVTASGGALASVLGGIIINYSSFNVLSITFVGFSFFLSWFILGPLGDVADVKGDKKVGRRTFPIVLGMKPTLLIMYLIPLVIVSAMGIIQLDGIIRVETIGFVAVIGSFIQLEVQILRVNRRLNENDYNTIKTIRPKMRISIVLTQICILFAFVI